ncbi:thymidine phosphorylase [Tomitella fengzijianii]|uniref:Thymidine phosphorylase n=1 Tax=Tomitella fengzijianii TaxID=2597660 RepID=A0A516X0Z7_9ACTN|nr:thymidine phosphorylase [Tomitella fengzijianii]QDQ96755.1 thymidine phosphorylase [Tomitella fengzijianii]
MDPVAVIARKRDGHELTDAEIRWAVAAYTSGAFADVQMAALLMAIVLRGMSAAETASLESAMRASGTTADLTGLRRGGARLPTADKHSTGGVGDKITLPLAPLVAACGAAVPQLSGRALGHTGGTLDKLESIPGWRADVPMRAFRRQLEDVGAVVCAAGADLAPADRAMYALRDITGTVESIPLIAASIMSKKLAEGSEALVLDVKVGSGAFMTDAGSARELARTMVRLGTDAGVRTTALLTAMDTPLGRTVGNALEVAEAVEVLAGGGPPDVVELTVALAREMLATAGLDSADPAARLADGAAMDRWRRMISAQGGDPDAPLPAARHVDTVRAEPGAAGVVTRLDARAVGEAARILGAGRRGPGDRVQAGAGIEIHARPGERVAAGGRLLSLHTDAPERFAAAREALAGAIDIGPRGPAGVDAGAGGAGPLVLGRVT